MPLHKTLLWETGKGRCRTFLPFRDTFCLLNKAEGTADCLCLESPRYKGCLSTTLKRSLHPVAVRWVKDGKTLEESARHQLSQDGRTHTLTLPQARSTDVGQYLAIAVDATGETTASFALNVVSEADML